ncbi:uncharacterized protein N7459_002551 [Penicillium hispanicum]|uniref:uncharacterized protein n=1 Tax=Penicillium hispanicum TaxID=1080232 RepID=UPI0025404879|nr:uncharacterized protein N7459_002551 [Penicillium hispanicum]KAJ5586786.1 hypothetical protein N7459_002551 [Penicillium hispanicum]
MHIPGRGHQGRQDHRSPGLEEGLRGGRREDLPSLQGHREDHREDHRARGDGGDRDGRDLPSRRRGPCGEGHRGQGEVHQAGPGDRAPDRRGEVLGVDRGDDGGGGRDP